MDAAYTWHPGSNCLTPRWAIPVSLLPDEIISSWLVRAAFVQGCDPLALTGEIWQKWRIWTQDPDRLFDDQRIEQVCAVSGIPKDALGEATLYPIASKIAGAHLPEKALWPWMLTLGTRNTKRRSGLQYCSLCLAEDAVPYYRLQWRFAWHVGCEKHGCTLLDRCYACSAPVEPHRLFAEDQQISLCATCRADLRAALPSPYAIGTLEFQRVADQVALHGHGQFQGQTVAVKQWFELASFFVSLIRRANRSRNEALNSFLRQLEVQLPAELPVTSGVGIELLRTHERQQIVHSLPPLMMADRKQFELAQKSSGITLQTLCEKGRNLPEALFDTSLSLQNKPRVRAVKPRRKLAGPRPRNEVIRMMDKLQRKLEMSNR